MNVLPLSRRRLVGFLPAFFLGGEVYAGSVEEKIAGIRARYMAIEGAALRSRTFEFKAPEEPLSGSCTRHYDGGDLVKIDLSYGLGDHGASDESFYYTKGVLFFAFASDGSWSFTGANLPSGESETVDRLVEHRVYVEDGAILRHLEKTVSSRNPAELGALLLKAPNVPGVDTERATELLRHGLEAVRVEDAASAIGLLLRPG